MQAYVDGELVCTIDSDFEAKTELFFTYGSPEFVIEREFEAGRNYNIVLECHSHDRQLQPELLNRLSPMEDKFQGARLGYAERDDSDLPSEAAELAGSCDAVIVVVGRDKEWESEGQDIPIFELPGDQVQLIENVASVCKRTIVVVQAGSPVRMDPWESHVQGILYTWYQGQELGNAAASVICGDINPSGRLPMTFPKRIEDCPAFPSFPGEQQRTLYSEGLFVGYKWWDLLDISPKYPFGFGLSYNRFDLFGAHIDATQLLPSMRSFTASTRVRNLGGSPLSGRQTVIVWCSLISRARLMRPKKQVCGFAKTPSLKPGQQCEVAINIEPYALGVFDPARHRWVIDAGSRFDILIGTDALHTSVAGSIEVSHEISWIQNIEY